MYQACYKLTFGKRKVIKNENKNFAIDKKMLCQKKNR